MIATGLAGCMDSAAEVAASTWAQPSPAPAVAAGAADPAGAAGAQYPLPGLVARVPVARVPAVQPGQVGH